MSRNTNHEKTILQMKKGYLFLAVIILALVLICGALISKSKEQAGSLINIGFSLLSGALVPLIYLRIVNGSGDEESIESRYSQTVQKIISTKAEASSISHVTVANGLDEAELKQLIKKAQKRVWIMGSDLSKRVTRNYNELLWAARNNPNISIRLLMVNPQNIFTMYRYSEIDYDSPKEFYDAQRSSCKTISAMMKELQQEATSPCMEARLYNTQPTTVIMLIDDQLFVSNYVLNHRTSNSMVVRYQIEDDTSNKAFRDYIQGHFQREWNRAQPLDMKRIPLQFDQNNLSAMGRNGNHSFSVAQKWVWQYSLTIKLRQMKNGIKRLWNTHSASLQPAMAAVLVSILMLGAVRLQWGRNIINPDAYEILSTNISSMVLGIIIGSALSVAEYFVEFRKLMRISAEGETAHLESMVQLEKHIFQNECCSHGVRIFENREAAELDRRIREAKKRVWVYATNHSFLSGNSVEDTFQNGSSCEYRFLLLKPTSLFLVTRYLDIPDKDIPEEFSIEVAAHLSHLQKKSNKITNLQVRLYTRTPNFMLYIIDDTLILSCITSNGKARDQIHVALDMSYPYIRTLAEAYVSHYIAVWDEAEKCSKSHIHPIDSQKMKVDMIDKKHMMRLAAAYSPDKQ